MKFMLMMNAPSGTGDWDVGRWSQDDVHALVGFMKQLNADLHAQGRLVGAEGLAPPGQARIVKAGSDGAPVVTDGPFAETKEFLAGYWIVEVDEPHQAYEIAARVSAQPGPGGVPLCIPVEVREVTSPPV